MPYVTQNLSTAANDALRLLALTHRVTTRDLLSALLLHTIKAASPDEMTEIIARANLTRKARGVKRGKRMPALPDPEVAMERLAKAATTRAEAPERAQAVADEADRRLVTYIRSGKAPLYARYHRRLAARPDLMPADELARIPVVENMPGDPA